jgi:hypothetical protein
MSRTDDIVARAEAAERSCEWEAAAALYRVLDESGANGDVASVVNAARRTALVRLAQGRYEEAEELATLSIEVAKRNELAECAA